MEFKKRGEYSINGKGFFYQISGEHSKLDEFVHYTNGANPSVITWIRGNKRTEQKCKDGTPLGVVGNSFFFKEDEIIKKAELINDHIVITESVKIEKRIYFHFNRHCLHYFIIRDNNTNISFAIPINEDYRSNNGIKFNVRFDKLMELSQIHVHHNSLFGITNHGILAPSTIRRYQSDLEGCLEKKDLPWICLQSVKFNNWIFYLNLVGHLIAVNMNDFSYEIIKTNLERGSNIVGIDENGMVNAQTYYEKSPELLTAKLPEKYISRHNMHKLSDDNRKRIEELERKIENEKKGKEELQKRLQTEQKEKGELFRIKTLLEKSLENEEKNRNGLERRLQTEQDEKEEPLKRLEIGREEKNELERKLEHKDKKDEELLMNKEELEKRNAVMEVEMKDLKLKYNKLLVRMSTWDSDHAEKK